MKKEINDGKERIIFEESDKARIFDLAFLATLQKIPISDKDFVAEMEKNIDRVCSIIADMEQIKHEYEWCSKKFSHNFFLKPLD